MDIYKCPILENGLRELKFSYIITLSASALPFSRGYLYDLILYIRSGHVATIMLRNRNHDIFRYFMEDIQNMSQKSDIMFMKNYFPKFGDIFRKQTMLLHFAEYMPTDIDKITTDSVLSISPNDS
jgi:hypothetical protein